MLVNLEGVFGDARDNPAIEDPIVVLRHGIFGADSSLAALTSEIESHLPNATVDNRSYNWRLAVLQNGAELADHILQELDPDRPLILIGHSMGGLVCRVANVILSDGAKFDSLLPWLLPQLGYQDLIPRLQNKFSKKTNRKVNGLITLATPNSGAFLQGQVSGLCALLHVGVSAFASFQDPSIIDLTHDRLFRFLQQFSVSTPTLSISGSASSRFSALSGQATRKLASWTLKGWAGGLNLSQPNDWVVEDVSVNLTSSILPNEIVHHGRSLYMHLRAYEDCTSVTHINIYDRTSVRNHMFSFIARC